MLAFFSVPPLIGPAAAVILAAGALNGWYRILARNLAPALPRPAMIIVLIFALFPASELLSWAVNSGQLIELKYIASSLLFFAAMPVYARLSLSEATDIWRAMYRGAALACAGAGLVAAAGIWLGFKRAEGGAGNPVPFAVVLSVLLPMALCGWKDAEAKVRPWLAVAVLLGTTAIVLSGTRSMLAAALLNLILAFIYLARSAIPLRRLAAAGFLVLAIGTAIASSSDFIGRHFGNTLRDIEAIQRGDNSWSAGQRLRMWEAGVKLISERPVFGYGPHSVVEVMRRQTNEPGVESGLAFTHFHNLAINAWIRGGAPEFLAAMLVLFAPWLLCIRTLRRDGFGAGQLIANVLFVSYFVNSAISSGFWHDILTAFYIQTALCALYLCHSQKITAA
jgi:O-antigen ligase